MVGLLLRNGTGIGAYPSLIYFPAASRGEMGLDVNPALGYSIESLCHISSKTKCAIMIVLPFISRHVNLIHWREFIIRKSSGERGNYRWRECS